MVTMYSVNQPNVLERKMMVESRLEEPEIPVLSRQDAPAGRLTRSIEHGPRGVAGVGVEWEPGDAWRGSLLVIADNSD